MKKIIFIVQCVILVWFSQAHATQYFISPAGNDTLPGTIDQPLWSVQKAQEKVSAGDTVYIRGGTYIISPSDISKLEQSLFACISFLDKSGVSNNTIKYWAYPGEQPVFDFTAVKPADQRVVGFWVSGDYIHMKDIEITGIQVTILTHTESYCIYSWGNHNIFENINMHDNVGTGLRHRTGGYNLFLNCDAYNNHDNVSQDKLGKNCDGFGCHPKEGGAGNVFRGCRAWFNSDDGFDFIRSDETITVDSCWAFYNGYSQSFASLGDGNGFKAGGYAHDEAGLIPDPVPSNTIQYSLAVRNKANGFYSNHHLAGSTWLQNTAYRNASNYNMVNRESPESQNLDVPGYDHILKNNLSYMGRSHETSYIDTAACVLENNSFNLDVTITDKDFLSLDEELLMAPRQADGSLPEVDFMRLHPNSDLQDAGVDIGFTYAGDAPDLGAFEQPIPFTTIPTNFVIAEPLVYPNPARDKLIVSVENFDNIIIFDLLGRGYITKLNGNILDLSDLANGIYIVSITMKDSQKLQQKFIIKK